MQKQLQIRKKCISFSAVQLAEPKVTRPHKLMLIQWHLPTWFFDWLWHVDWVSFCVLKDRLYNPRSASLINLSTSFPEWGWSIHPPLLFSSVILHIHPSCLRTTIFQQYPFSGTSPHDRSQDGGVIFRIWQCQSPSHSSDLTPTPIQNTNQHPPSTHQAWQERGEENECFTTTGDPFPLSAGH